MSRNLCLAVALTLLGSTPQAQRPVVPDHVRGAADKITAENLKRDLDYLSSDELLGRQSPSPGFDKAADYIATRLGKAGLKPLGDNGTFLQHYTMRESRVDTAGAYLEIGGMRFAFGKDFVLRSFAQPVSGARAGRLRRSRMDGRRQGASIRSRGSTSRASWSSRTRSARCPRGWRSGRSGASASVRRRCSRRRRSAARPASSSCRPDAAVRRGSRWRRRTWSGVNSIRTCRPPTHRFRSPRRSWRAPPWTHCLPGSA